ncbi:MAG: immunoglobulin domain-containing protein [Phycisphaerales bacterium]
MNSHPFHVIVALALAAGPFVESSANPGDCEPHWRRGLDARIGATTFITSMRVVDLGDGPRLVVGGIFSAIGDAACQGIAMFDGTEWHALGSGFGGQASPPPFAQALVQFDDGSGPVLVAGGLFTSAGGVGTAHIAQWNGASWSQVGAGFDKQVRALAVGDLGDGPRLFAGGLFTTSGATPVSRIAEWDGRAWAPLGSGVNSNVYCAAVADLGDGPALYVGGFFTSAGEIGASKIAKWDGRAWSALGEMSGGANSSVEAMVVWDDGRGPALYVGGNFTTVDGMPALHVARWDGKNWSAVGPGLNNEVNALAVFDDGRGALLVAGGGFKVGDGAWPYTVARFDGTAWTPLGAGQNGYTVALASFPENGLATLYAGGTFRAADGAPVDCIAKWHGAADGGADTNAWSPIAAPQQGFFTNDRVQTALALDLPSGPAIVIGGRFGKVDGISAPCVARWDADGWSALGDELVGGVYDLVEFDDRTGPALYAGGYFDPPSGGPDFGVMRFDGSGWTPVGGSMEGSAPLVRALCVFDDGTGPALYAAGSFTAIGGVTAKNIARWDGAAWHALGSGLSQEGRVLHVHDDGSGPALYVGGPFMKAGDLSTQGIARWNGTTWESVGSGPQAVEVGGLGATAFATFDDGNGPALYMAGEYVQVGGAGDISYGVMRWTGTSWSQVGDDIYAWIRVLTVHDDGGGPSLFAGGGREYFGGGPPIGPMLRWSGATWQSMDGGLGAVPGGIWGGVSDAVAVGGGGLLVVGEFGSAVASEGGGIVARNLAWWGRRDSAWIVRQPHDVSVRAGRTIVLSAGVMAEPAAPPPTFQWRHEGVTLMDGDGIGGATSDTLVVANAAGGDAGAYDVVVTDACGETMSRTAVVIVLCAADLDANGTVDSADLGVMLGAWGADSADADLNGDDAVDGADLALLLAAWGPCGDLAYHPSGERVSSANPRSAWR